MPGAPGSRGPKPDLIFVYSNIQMLVDIHLFYILQLIFVNFHQVLITFDQSGWLHWLACTVPDAALWSFYVFTVIEITAICQTDKFALIIKFEFTLHFTIVMCLMVIIVSTLIIIVFFCKFRIGYGTFMQFVQVNLSLSIGYTTAMAAGI